MLPFVEQRSEKLLLVADTTINSDSVTFSTEEKLSFTATFSGTEYYTTSNVQSSVYDVLTGRFDATQSALTTYFVSRCKYVKVKVKSR